jgi:hypothetical protein
MSFHTDYAGWKRMADPQRCPVCSNAPMSDGMDDPFPDKAIDYTQKQNQYAGVNPRRL